MKNFSLFFIIILSSLVFISGCSDKSITVHFIDVGDSLNITHGDSIFIDTPEKDVLIDGGESDKAYLVVELLKSLNVSKVDYIIATHPHADHIDGLVDVMREFDVREVLYNGQNSSQSAEFDAEMRKHDYSAVKKGDIFNISDLVYLEVLHPSEGFRARTGNTGENDMSLVIRLVYGNVSFLFMGDCEKACNDYLLNSSDVLDADVIKIGHHCDSSSSSADFLRAVNPEIAVITPGGHDRWGLPSKECVDRINQSGIKMYSTADGDVVIVTDGVHINVSEERN